MATFFDFPVNAPQPCEPIKAAWHPAKRQLAVAATEKRQGMSTGIISMYTDDGEHVVDATLQRAARPTDLAWHPKDGILATGWASGEVLLWNDDVGKTVECKRVHESAIVFVCWSVDGSRLFTADEEGLICAYSVSSSSSTATVLGEINIQQPVVTGVAIGNAGGSGSMIMVATDSGKVFRCTASGDFDDAFDMDNAVHAMSYDNESGLLITIDTGMKVVQYRVAGDGQLSDQYFFKLAGKVPGQMSWVGSGVIAFTTGESMIRVWNADAGDLYSLSIADHHGEFAPSDILVSVNCDRNSHTLAAGSRNGFVFIWKLNGATPNEAESEHWTFQSPVELAGGVQGVTWGPRHMLAAYNAIDTVSILREHVMRKAFAHNIVAMQVSSQRLVVEVLGVQTHNVDSDFAIKGIAVSADAVVVWGAKEVAVHELVRDGSVLRSSNAFKCEATCCAIHGSTVFTAEEGRIDARTFNGSSKQLLAFPSNEGNITHLAVNGDAMVAATDACFVRGYDLSRREARLSSGPYNTADEMDSIAAITINSSGNFVAYRGVSEGSGQPMVWLWCTENDKSFHRSFGSGKFPVNMAWDTEDERLFVVETQGVDATGNESRQATSAFASEDRGFVIHHTFDLTGDYGALVGVKTPFLIFSKQTKGDKDSAVIKHALRDFKGLEDADRDTRVAMLEFSYQLTMGNLDEAFKAVRVIQSDAVWANMARMCVSTQRMDVAIVCMGRMGNAMAARALRDVANESDGAKAATLAMHLGMLAEAEQHLKSEERYDLLVQLYRDSNRWADALQVASDHDRLHLRTTYFEQAQHLEALGKINEAVKAYENAGAAHTEVPRLLLNHESDLEAYVRASQSKELFRWWAQYKESKQDMDEALRYYGAADDVLSLVRVYCFQDDHEKAHELVRRTQNKAAAYHLARQYEAKDNIEEAIDLYSLSECYTNAIRLAKEHGLKERMLNLALNSTKVDMISAGEFYESQGLYDKAVMLYHKGGRVAKALEMCFEHSCFAALGSIAADLDENTDPALLERAANFFQDHKQFDKAVNLLVVAKQFNEALDLIQRHNVHLTDEHAEKMTYAKGTVEKSVRNALLARVADVANAQGSYQLATKKYTQAGQLTKAMKSLLRGGDTEKIMFFANKCRQKDVYVMAANYLQSLQWRSDPEIIKNIIAFYTKGRALDSLSSFYESCAALEIDDYQAYEKALGALNEALRCLSKAKMKDLSAQEQRISSLQTRIMLTEKFVNIRKLAETNPSEMLEEAQSLLHESDINDAVRLGDIYSLIIEHLASKEQHSEAYKMMQELKQRVPRANLAYYISLSVIETVHRALDIPLGTGTGPAHADDDDVAEDIASEAV